MKDEKLIAALRSMSENVGKVGGCCLECEFACTTYDCALLQQAIHRLEELTAPPPNPTLTLEELREMGLNKWLWIDIIIPAAYRRIQSGYYQTHKDYTYGEAFCCGWPGTICDFDYVDYGKTWTAYRRKPEEGK